MQTVTGNAACAIAFRNAVFKVIPKAVTKNAIERIKQVALGKATDLSSNRAKALKWYNQSGVTTDDLLEYLEVGSIEDIDAEKTFSLQAMANAIYNGETSIEDAILTPLKERRKEALAKKEANTNKDIVAQAMAKQ